jgi:hypothetical protein
MRFREWQVGMEITDYGLFEQLLRVGSINAARFFDSLHINFLRKLLHHGNSRLCNFMFRQSRLSKGETQVIKISKIINTFMMMCAT